MSCINNTGRDIIRMVYSSEHKLHSYKGKLRSASSPLSVCPPLSRAPRKIIGGPIGGALFASTIVLLLYYTLKSSRLIQLYKSSFCGAQRTRVESLGPMLASVPDAVLAVASPALTMGFALSRVTGMNDSLIELCPALACAISRYHRYTYLHCFRSYYFFVLYLFDDCQCLTHFFDRPILFPRISATDSQTFPDEIVVSTYRVRNRT